ncbi:hypothetical protein BGZ83_006595 [Gryganskiella cystojenkinii]|nr:hypothetical protein BGZ83_006595 [Gryganskiella cystojenkinii]
MHFKTALIALVAALVSVQATTDSTDASDASKIVVVENNLGSSLPIATTSSLYGGRHYRYPIDYYSGDLIRPYHHTFPGSRLYRRSDDGAADAENGESKALVDSDEDENEKFLMFPYYGYRRFYRPFFYRRPYIFM